MANSVDPDETISSESAQFAKVSDWSVYRDERVNPGILTLIQYFGDLKLNVGMGEAR